MSKGFVYILSNDHMPGLLKIGMTRRTVESRAEELFQTGVPGRFKVESEVFSPDCSQLERWVHIALAERRVSIGREFFKVSVSDAVSCLDALLEDQVSEIVSDHLETHVLTPQPYFVDPGSLELIGMIIGRSGSDVADMLGEVKCSDDTIDFEVLAERMERRRRACRAASGAHRGAMQ